MATTPAESEVIRAASNPPRGPRTPKEREFIVLGRVEQEVDGGGYVDAWVEVGRATVTGIFDEKMRDEAEAQVTDKLPLDEQGGPFVTIAASAWQPREYETETITRRKPKAVK